MKTKIVIEIETHNAGKFFKDEDVAFEEHPTKSDYTPKKEVLASVLADVTYYIQNLLEKGLEKEEINNYAEEGGFDEFWLACEGADTMEDYCDLKITLKSKGNEDIALLDVKRKETTKTEETPHTITPVLDTAATPTKPNKEPTKETTTEKVNP